MMRGRGLGAVVVAAAVAMGLTPALAGRPPTDQERPKVEAAVTALGFTRWDSIVFDDGVWKIKNAEGGTGKNVDLKLRPKTFEVIENKQD